MNRRSKVLLRGIGRDAKTLGVCHQRLRAVLHCQRDEPELLARYLALVKSPGYVEFHYKERKDAKVSISKGLARLAGFRRPGETFTLEQIAIFCKCHRNNIWLIEQRALRKLREGFKSLGILKFPT
jgi:hypothetical protein